MINNIIDKNIIFLRNHGVKINSEDEKAIYKYGLQILYYYIIDLLVIFSLAYIFGRLYETVIMTAIFGLLQVFGGGYHAKTPLGCLLTMLAGAAAGNIIIMLVADKILFNIICAVILGGAILILTPITNKNHPINAKVKQRSKIIIRVVIMSILAVVFVLGCFNRTVEIAAISAILGLYFISLLCVKIHTKYFNYLFR